MTHDRRLVGIFFLIVGVGALIQAFFISIELLRFLVLVTGLALTGTGVYRLATPR